MRTVFSSIFRSHKIEKKSFIIKRSFFSCKMEVISLKMNFNNNHRWNKSKLIAHKAKKKKRFSATIWKNIITCMIFAQKKKLSPLVLMEKLVRKLKL